MKRDDVANQQIQAMLTDSVHAKLLRNIDLTNMIMAAVLLPDAYQAWLATNL